VKRQEGWYIHRPFCFLLIECLIIPRLFPGSVVDGYEISIAARRLSGFTDVAPHLRPGLDKVTTPSDSFGNLTGLNKPPSQYFSNFLNAYARGVNLATGRTGALFQRPFKRIPALAGSKLYQTIDLIEQTSNKHNELLKLYGRKGG